MFAQPLIAVHNIQTSSRWYQSILGLTSGHGGTVYEQLLDGERMVLQLHHWDAHDHPYLGDPVIASRGNGAVLWFQSPAVREAFARAKANQATVLEPLRRNPNANHLEFWLRDPDGYTVVVAGDYGDVK
jgi:catechol 2,3-dioxygenase-like lactoylglutathione lyase family enzyme